MEQKKPAVERKRCWQMEFITDGKGTFQPTVTYLEITSQLL